MPDTLELRPILDPIAFAGALVLAPLVFTALSFWAALIPVAALILGAVPYLLFGTPVFLWMVTRYPVTGGTFALGGLLAHAGFVICFGAWLTLAPYDQRQTVAVFALCGVPFAAAWAATFARFYRAFYRPLIA